MAAGKDTGGKPEQRFRGPVAKLLEDYILPQSAIPGQPGPIRLMLRKWFPLLLVIVAVSLRMLIETYIPHAVLVLGDASALVWDCTGMWKRNAS